MYEGSETILQMAPPTNPPKALLLSIWFLSLLLWLFVSIAILTIDQNAESWLLGFIAFIVSFTCLVMYLTFWWRIGFRSLASRFVRASLLTTGLYSLLLFGYVTARVMLDQVPINDPFIDVLLPWFTFLRLAVGALALGFFSVLAYLAFFWASDRKSAVERSAE